MLFQLFIKNNDKRKVHITVTKNIVLCSPLLCQVLLNESNIRNIRDISIHLNISYSSTISLKYYIEKILCRPISSDLEEVDKFIRHVKHAHLKKTWSEIASCAVLFGWSKLLVIATRQYNNCERISHNKTI